MPASTKHIQTNLSRIAEAKHPELTKIVRESKSEVQKRLVDTGLKSAEAKNIEMWSSMTWALVVARAEQAGLATELPGTRGQQARRTARIAAGLPVRRTKAQKIADEAAKAENASPTPTTRQEDDNMSDDPAEFEDDSEDKDNQ